MSVLEHGDAGEQVGFLDDNGVRGRVGLQRHRIASAGCSNGLRVDRRGTVFAHDSTWSLEEAYRTANLAGVEYRDHFTVRFFVEQEANVSSAFPRDVAVQVAIRNLDQRNAHCTVAETDRSRRRKRIDA